MPQSHLRVSLNSNCHVRTRCRFSSSAVLSLVALCSLQGLGGHLQIAHAEHRVLMQDAEYGGRTQFIDFQPGIIVGELAHESAFVRFESRLQSPSIIVTRVSVDGLVLNAEVNDAAKTAVLDGIGEPLTLEQRLALDEAARDLELIVAGRGGSIHPVEDKLYRVLSVYILGFADYQTGPIEIQATFGTCNPVDAVTDYPICGEAAGNNSEPEVFVGCNSSNQENAQADENRPTVCYLRGTGDNDGCECARYYVSHDEFLGHGNCAEILGAGCHLDRDCRGRGGAKCTGGVLLADCSLTGGRKTGHGIYTIDFASHDRCCDVHSGDPCIDLDCANEALAALDDCVMGQPNCVEGCCNPSVSYTGLIGFPEGRTTQNMTSVTPFRRTMMKRSAEGSQTRSAERRGDFRTRAVRNRRAPGCFRQC